MDMRPQPIDEAIISELRGNRLDGTTLISSESSSTQRFDHSGATLVTRFSRGQKKSGSVVTPAGVAIPNVLSWNTKLREFADFDGNYGILDIDGVAETVVKKRSASDILALFGSLREDMRPVLERLVDETTFRSWS
jgi:hypothetical protein